MYSPRRSGQLLRLDRHEVLGFPEANAKAIGISVLGGFHLGAIEGVTAVAELHRRQRVAWTTALRPIAFGLPAV
jgi:hypothetical protein